MINIKNLINEEVAKYKWYRGEENTHLSWEEAEKEWMEKYYHEFIKQNKNKRRLRFNFGNVRTKIPFHIGIE